MTDTEDRPLNPYEVPSIADLRWYYEDFCKRVDQESSDAEVDRAEDIADYLDMEERIERHARVVARLRANPVERPPRQRRFINLAGDETSGSRFTTKFHHFAEPVSARATRTSSMYVAEWVRTNKYRHRPQRLSTTRQLQARKAHGSDL